MDKGESKISAFAAYESMKKQTPAEKKPKGPRRGTKAYMLESILSEKQKSLNTNSLTDAITNVKKDKSPNKVENKNNKDKVVKMKTEKKKFQLKLKLQEKIKKAKAKTTKNTEKLSTKNSPVIKLMKLNDTNVDNITNNFKMPLNQSTPLQNGFATSLDNTMKHANLKSNKRKNKKTSDTIEEKSSIVLNNTENLNKNSLKSPKPTNNSNNNHIRETTPLAVAIKIEPKTPKVAKTSVHTNDSIFEGKNMFGWIIRPIAVDDFIENYWEKKPLFVKRKQLNYYKDLVSTDEIDKMLRENHVEFTKNIDVTSYRNGVRETHNSVGRVLPPAIWDAYSNGCSIRMLNPQTFLPQIYKMNATVQEYFHCMVGTNIYLTPPNSQGFAPHYDDIEAFVLQIEGKKHWKLYAPLSIDDTLPRTSSVNFNQNEIGDPILDVVLEAGDLLYFPRGIIHQAVTVKDHHSLHLTLSVYQKNSWADLMEILVPTALQQAIASDVEFRRGIPIDITKTMGFIYSDQKSQDRSEIKKKIKSFLNKLIDHISIDNAVDLMSKRYQYDALPPLIVKHEQERTIYGNQVTLNDVGEVFDPFDMAMTTSIRLLRANILRMINEENTIRIYYHSDNSREYHEYEPCYFDADIEDAPALEYLIRTYPEYIEVIDLPIDNEERKLNIANNLWELGLIMTADKI